MPTFLPYPRILSKPNFYFAHPYSMNTIEYAATVADKKRRVFATFPAAYKRASISGEVFSSKDAAILRLKDWSCM